MNMQELINQDQIMQQRYPPERLDNEGNASSSNQDSGAISCANDDQSVDQVANDGDPSSAFNNKTFPEILAEILSTVRNQRAIAWLPHGKAFMILDRERFVADILPNYLGKSTKYTSFTRKLSRWKFQRVQCGPEEGAWIHDNFTRDDLSGMTQMKCAKRKKPTKRTKDYPRTVPLKKRPVDASLFTVVTKSRSNSNVSSMSTAEWDDRELRRQQQHHQQQHHQQQQIRSMMQHQSNQQHSQHHNPRQPSMNIVQGPTPDPTTASIVSAAVKVLLQSNQSEPLSPPQSRRYPSFSGTPNPLNLLQALQAARTIPMNNGGPSDTLTALRLQHFMQQQQQNQGHQQHQGHQR